MRLTYGEWTQKNIKDVEWMIEDFHKILIKDVNYMANLMDCVQDGIQ